MKRLLTSLSVAFIAALFFTGCEGFFGKDTDLDFIDAPDFQNRDVAYVPILPIIEGFLDPTDVIAGFDELIYVVDAQTEEIIGFDKAGREQGRFQLQGVKKITQDLRLNILALGSIDTVINEVEYTLSCIYRLDLNSPLGYGIENAQIVNKVVNPFYFKSSFSAADAPVEFTSIDVLSDNQYYVTRVGERTNTSQIGGPDDGVLIFTNDDEYQSNVFITASTGFFSDWFKTPLSIATYAKPPQAFAPNESKDFFVAMADPELAVKVQSIQFFESEFGSSFEVQILANNDSTEANDFLYRLNRFMTPTDMVITGDGTNYLLVIDEDTDSLYQFTTTGLEGVQPPPGSSTTKNIIVSFGGTGEEATQFRNPSAVAYSDQIVYVADRGNGRLLRFKLTTDFD